MSRSARIRAARRAPINRTTPAARPIPDHMRRSEPMPISAGPRRSSVRYAGSGDDGYRSAWARPMTFVNAATIDRRWSDTVGTV